MFPVEENLCHLPDARVVAEAPPGRIVLTSRDARLPSLRSVASIRAVDGTFSGRRRSCAP